MTTRKRADFLPAEDAILRDLASQGKSSALIVVALGLAGYARTKNGVLKRAERLQLEMRCRSGRRKQPNERRAALDKPRPAPKRAAPVLARQAVAEPAPLLAGPVRDIVEQLTERNCHWPYGSIHDGNLRFCGHPRWAKEGAPLYCEHHAAISRSQPTRADK